MLTLRPYQTQMVDGVRAEFHAGRHRVMLQAPTGCGKTAIATYMLGQTVAVNRSAWFIVHRRELLKQSADAFERAGVPYHVVATAWTKRPAETPGRGVLLTSIQTVARRVSSMHVPGLIVWDESHHVAAKSWTSLFEWAKASWHVGLSATPERLDGKGLDKWFDSMVEGPSTAWLIEQGYLCPFVPLVPPNGIEASGVKKSMGDYARGQLAAISDVPTITGNAVEHYKKWAPGKRAIAFCVSVNHSKHVAEQFNAAGIPAAHCDGQTAPDVRDAILEDFRNGKLLLLSNVELFGEGFDVPGIEAVIMLRPTQSVALYLQQVGRSLRPAPGKERAIILDHAGNIERHGRPDDLWAWDLQGKEAREKRSKSKRLSMTICPECFAAQPAGASRCVICGHAFGLAGGDRVVKQVAGELVEHKSRVKDPRFQITETDLARMFRRKGMPEAMCIALAAKTFKARQAKQGVAA